MLDEVIHMLYGVRDDIAADTHNVLSSADNDHRPLDGRFQRLTSIDSVELRDPLNMDSEQVQ